MDDAHNDLLAVTGDLRHLQSPVQQQIKGLGGAPLLEDSLALRDPASARLRSHPIELCVAHRRKERNTAQHAPIHGHDDVFLRPARKRGSVQSLYRRTQDKTPIVAAVQVRHDTPASAILAPAKRQMSAA